MELRDGLFGTPHKIVMDPVHGGIHIFEHEAKIINHPTFQRLRFIVQNDVTSLVFPGATHTRFQHSIGAMYVAGKFFKVLIRTYLGDPRNNRSTSITEKQADAIRFFYLHLRLAALLHDVGHFPFSHQFERSKEIQKTLNDPEVFAKLWPNDSWKSYYNSQAPKHLSHEHYSVWCAHNILNDLRTEVDHIIEPHDVISLMETTTCNPSDKFKRAARELLTLLLRDPTESKKISDEIALSVFKTFFTKILSGELDIDKMDYLLRDSFFSGCKYGIYNLDHLLSILRIGYEKYPDLWVGLAIAERGIGPLEDFIYSRFQLYQMLYSHKTVVGFKWLLQNALNEVLKFPRIQERVQKSLTEVHAHQNFTDTFFWECFRELSADVPGCAADLLMKRTKLKHLKQRADLSDREKKKYAGKLSEKIGKEVVYDESPIKFSKIAQRTYDDIKILMSEPDEEKRTLVGIKEESNFFDKFKDMEITHFYIKPTLSDVSLDLPLFGNNKN